MAEFSPISPPVVAAPASFVDAFVWPWGAAHDLVLIGFAAAAGLNLFNGFIFVYKKEDDPANNATRIAGT